MQVGVQKVSGKNSIVFKDDSENCRISEMQTIQPKNQDVKSIGTEIPGMKSSTIWLYLAGFLSFPERAVPFATW